MKTYRVYATRTHSMEALVTAETPEEAIEEAKESHAGIFATVRSDFTFDKAEETYND